ncbi:hypothetical protein AX17_007086 [Amanita inopinata Kibby_2008]|nr:hypothetical protein AX17_007086 [Amanita inopinata Kibby_2008]
MLVFCPLRSTVKLTKNGLSYLNFIRNRRISLKTPSESAYLESCPDSGISNLQPARKLVILDLNGTLLYRSSSAPQPHPRMSKRGSDRIVCPRPYVPTLCRYLFHQETRTWLDTMVWSSAQPHNVATMVHACFGVYQDKLLRVWARDRMGLSLDSYGKKVQTIKDLEKVWDYLKSQPSLPQHSVFTTILIDDSAKKGVLQPYNLLRVKEYDHVMRKSDLSRTLRALHLSSRSTPTIATDFPYDMTLLALVGILEALKMESNVAKWMKDGGTLSSDIQPHPDGQDCKVWFEDDTNVKHWVDRGLKTLSRLGISADAGIRQLP